MTDGSYIFGNLYSIFFYDGNFKYSSSIQFFVDFAFDETSFDIGIGFER